MCTCVMTDYVCERVCVSARVCVCVYVCVCARVHLRVHMCSWMYTIIDVNANLNQRPKGGNSPRDG